MNYEERRKFRKTKEWKDFKAKCRLHTSKDYITNEFLRKDWNLHHLDLDASRYSDLSDMNRFMPLNPKTHETVHEVYKWYKKDRKSLDRLREVLDKMYSYTEANNERLKD